LKRKEHELTDLENAIKRFSLRILQMVREKPKMYTAMADNLKTLMEARQIESDVEKPRNDISVETIATVAATSSGSS